jgi:phage terminase small subunit
MIDADKVYKKYSKEVRNYMKNLLNSLTAQYGAVPDEWRVSLDLIAFNYNTILLCQKDIEQNGLRNGEKRNPALTTLNNAQLYLMKLLHDFGLTVYAKSKLKDMDTSDAVLDDLLS